MQSPQQASLTFGVDDGVILPRLPRLKRPDPPNKDAHYEHIDALQTQIDSLQQRIQDIKSTLDNKNRHVACPELTDARNKLAFLNAEFKAAVEMKRRHREELDLVKEKLRESGKSGLPDVSIGALDEEIRNLEYRQTHTTLSIDEERRLVTQISRLRKSRDSLRHHDNRVEHDQGSRVQLVELIKKDEEKLNFLKAEQEQQREILALIRDKEAALTHNMQSLIQERNSAYEKIKDLREDIKQSKAEFVATEDKYWKREREWRAQQAVERKVKAEKSRADWLERERIRKQRDLENFVEPYTHEIILCEQLISYMHKNAPLEEEAAAPQMQQKAEILAPTGFGVAIVSKKNRNEDDLDGWFAGSGGKKGKKGKGPAPSKSKVREKISLSIDALSSFEKIKVSPPLTYGDVSKSLEKLKTKKDEFVVLQKKAREARQREQSGETVGEDGLASEISCEEPLEISCEEPVAGGSYSNGGSRIECDVLCDSLSLHTDDLTVELEAVPGTNLGVQENTDNSKGDSDTIKDQDFVKDVGNEGQIYDKAHLENFEFSEIQVDTQANKDADDVPTVEEVVENGILEDGLGQVSVGENGRYSHAPECDWTPHPSSSGAHVDGSAEELNVEIEHEHSTEVLESIEILQAAKNKAENVYPSKTDHIVESMEDLDQKAAQLVADSAMDPSATEVLQNDPEEERPTRSKSDH